MFAIPNAGKRTKWERGRLLAEGMKAGVPDVCLPVRTRYFGALWIEHKTKTGVLSPEQKVWHGLLKSCGHNVIVSRSFEESRAAVIEHLEDVKLKF
jgi:hypothetical protein